jgi:hypothetical protein
MTAYSTADQVGKNYPQPTNGNGRIRRKRRSYRQRLEEVVAEARLPREARVLLKPTIPTLARHRHVKLAHVYRELGGVRQRKLPSEPELLEAVRTRGVDWAWDHLIDPLIK